MKVIVSGASGKMGQASCAAVEKAADMSLVGKAGRHDNLADMIRSSQADVVVDMTHPSSVKQNVTTILENGAHAVVGTTGLTQDDLAELNDLATSKGKTCIVCPNFAIGAVLMMQFAAQAAQVLTDVEIIEYHHNKKADAPSGTALKTAELIQEKAAVNTTPLDEEETVPGARGGRHANVPIHSVRLPGVIANQDVILGGDGETLTLSHRSLSRECFMPGVLLCIRKAPEMSGVVYGLENLLSL